MNVTIEKQTWEQYQIDACDVWNKKVCINMWPNTMEWVALRIWETWEKGNSKKKEEIIPVHDVFCQNRPIVVPRYDTCTPNML
jgi:hypothetical protein